MKNKKKFYELLLTAYALAMIWLMLLSRIGSAHSNALSLVPFHTTIAFWNNLVIGITYNIMPLAFSAFANLAGNIIFFIPLGLLIPAIWRAQRIYPIFFLTVTAVIIAMEAVQYLSHLGTADIDDLIFNLVGASIGFLIRYLSGRKKARRKS